MTLFSLSIRLCRHPQLMVNETRQRAKRIRGKTSRLWTKRRHAVLEDGQYGPVWDTSTSLADWKPYRHFFSEKSHTGMLCRPFCEIQATGRWCLHRSVARITLAWVKEGKEGSATIPALIFSRFEPCWWRNVKRDEMCWYCTYYKTPAI